LARQIACYGVNPLSCQCEACFRIISLATMWTCAVSCYAPVGYVGKAAISVAFVHTSVRPFLLAYIANNIIQEPKGLACPNMKGRFPTFGTTRIPVSRSTGQRSRSPGRLMLIHIVRYIFRMARSTNFKLGTRIENDDPHQSQAP